jgi:low affinity Fe/Cu permease
VSELFRKFSHRVSAMVGSPWAFIIAAAVIVVWAVSGPLFHFSDTWQLVINTGTTIVTFLMVFLIQNTQNRDARAMHLKLDELLKGVHGARTSLVDLEDSSDEELEKLQKAFELLREKEGGPGTSLHEKTKEVPRGRKEQKPDATNRRSTA